MKKWLLTFITLFISLVVCAAIGFALLLFFAGPHSDVFPEWSHKIFLIIVWGFVLATPAVLARKVYKHSNK